MDTKYNVGMDTGQINTKHEKIDQPAMLTANNVVLRAILSCAGVSVFFGIIGPVIRLLYTLFPYLSVNANPSPKPTTSETLSFVSMPFAIFLKTWLLCGNSFLEKSGKFGGKHDLFCLF